jgi:hypothetical protein
MIINEFRFLTINDKVDVAYQNWSRCAEYKWIMDKLAIRWQNDPEELSCIHNTCCGGSHIVHKQFHDTLLDFCKQKHIYLTNSDINPTAISQTFEAFKIWNMLTPLKDNFGFRLTYDVVLCISTLEELSNPEDLKTAFYNLYEQVTPRGQLLITCDNPDKQLNTSNSIILQLDTLIKIVNKTPDREKCILNGNNSVYPQLEFGNMNVIVLDIQKEGV